MILQPCFCSSAPLNATEGFVWEGNARRLDFDCSRELCSPDVPFDQVTLPLLTGRQMTQRWSTVAAGISVDDAASPSGPQAPDVMCDMSASSAFVPAWLPFSTLYHPSFPLSSLFCSRCRSRGLPRIGLCV